MTATVLVIYGSPHLKGATAKVLNRYLGTLSNAPDRQVVYFNCFEQSIAPCDDCRCCKAGGRCCHQDLNEFFDLFEAAERVIFAFPVYNASFPAPMKTVIDRFQPYFYRHFSGQDPFKTKRPATLLLTYGANKDLTDVIRAQIEPLFSVTGCYLDEVIAEYNQDNK